MRGSGGGGRDGWRGGPSEVALVCDLPLRFPSRAAEASLLRGGREGQPTGLGRLARSIDRSEEGPLDFSGNASCVRPEGMELGL
jgi:hypothetical protein